MRQRALALLMSAVLALGLPLSSFALTANSVLSHDIRPADGTTGQNVTTGSGIKTGHIQDGAVTSQKVADGAITDAKISGTISGTKIGTHSQNGADIVDGSITDTKISGTISGTKLGPHTHSVTDISGGTIPVENLATYQNIKIVHKGAINSTNIFNTITDALNSINDASSVNRYTIMVMPGDYQESITMKEWVTIKGAGVLATQIINAAESTYTVSGADNSSIQDLTIVFNLPGGAAVTISNTSPIIKNCHIKSVHMYAGNIMYITGGSPLIDNCSLTSTSNSTQITGIMLTGGTSAIIMNSTVNLVGQYTLYAIYVNGEINNAKIVNSHVSVTSNSYSYSIYAYGNNTKLNIISSYLKGVIFSFDSINTIKLVNCYDDNYNSIPNL